MAKKISNLAEVKVYINGKEQAKRDLEELTSKAEEYKKMIEASRSRVVSLGEETEKNPEKVVAYDEERKNLNKLEKEYKKYQRLIRETKKFTEDIEEDLNNLSGQSLARLKTIERSLTAIRQKLDPNEDKDGDFLAFLNESLKRVGEAIKNRKGDLIEFKDIVDDLANIDDTSLSKVEQRIKSLIAATDKDDVDRMQQLKNELQQVKGEQSIRLEDEAQIVIEGDYSKTIEGIKEAIELLKKYQQTLNSSDSESMKNVSEAIDNMNKELMESQKINALNVLTGDLNDKSIKHIKQSVDILTQYRETLKPLSPEWNEVTKAIENGKEKLKSLVDQTKLSSMNSQFEKLGTLSASALSEQKKYWQEMVNGAAAGSKELAVYEENLKKVIAEEQKRSKDSVKHIMISPEKYSVEEIRNAIRVTEQLRDSQKIGSKQWEEYSKQIGNANRVLDSFKDKAKMEAMSAQFRSLNILSKSALSEQKKFWQAMVDGAEKGSEELDKYEKNLKRVISEENKRASESGRALMSEVLSGDWKGTIAESKEAIKILKEYKDTLRTTDTASIKRVDKAISELSARTKIAEAGFKSTNEALKSLWRQAKNLGSGNWKGSLTELEEIRRKLIAIRDTQEKVLSAKDRDRLQKSLKNVDKEIAILKGDAIDINYILANMKDTPLWKLEKAAQQLQQEIRDCSEATGDFATKAAQLRRVNAQVDKLKKSFKEKESVISRTAQRLAAYVAIYGGFNFVLGKIKEMIQANLQLSDSFADVQKTTGLTAEQVKELSKSIDSIDTRTSQQQLHELAAVAGQLGLKSQTDILGFVKASNMISVSLNELGSEGTSSLMKIATLTGEASSGTEQALLKIGSAINELTANSAATAGPIVDLMNRMGGVASQAGLTSAQMAAIGATADALGQSMEITGTSMNKFVTTLMSSSDDIAYALNMDAKALRDMLESGNTMEAIVAVFERMNKMKGMGELAGVMGELGSEGARMTQVLTAMAKNVNFLKAQIDLSTEAYKEADSIQNEYNIKNENALAIWQRIGNMIKELFVNSFFVDILTGISRGIHNVLSLVIESEYFFKILASSIAAVTAALYANSAAWVKNLNAMGLAKGFETLMHTIGDKFMAVWETMAGAVSGGAKSFAKFTKEAWAAAEGTNAFKKATDMLGTSLKKLGAFLSRNWLTIAIAALAALVAWLITAATKTTELTRAIARYRREVEEEKNQVDALFTSLNRLNNTEADRAKIIDTINRKYGDYLGFMISEKDSAEKLAAAHKLINSELERRMALNLQNTLQGKANNVYAEKYEEETMAIERTIKGEGLFSPKIFKGKVSAGDVNSFVSKLVNDAVTAAIDNSGDYRKLGEIDEDVFMESVKEAMIKKFNYAETKTIKDTSGKTHTKTVILGEQLFDALEGNIEDLLEARVEYMEDIIDAERTADLEMGRITKNATKDRQDMLKVTEKEIEQLQKTTIQDSWTEEQTQEHYSKLLNALRGYINQSETIRKSMTDDEKKLYEQSMIEMEKAYKTYYDKIAPLAGEDPWGKNLNVKDWKDFADVVTNLDTSSADALVSAYKQLTEDTAKIPSNVKAFYKMFEGTGLETKLKLQDPKDIATQVHNWAEQIKNKLKDKYGRNTSGSFIFDSDEGSDRNVKAQVRQEYQAVMSALEAYYKEYEDFYRQRKEELGLTDETLNQQILENDRKFNEDRQQLIKKFLGEESTFDQTKYIGVLSGYDYFGKKDLEKMSKQYQQFGDAMTDGGRNQIAKSGLKVSEAINKEKQKIYNLLADKQYIQKAVKEMQDAFESLNIVDDNGNSLDNYLWGNTPTEKRTQEAAAERMKILQTFSEDVYSEEAESFKKRLLQDKVFGNTVSNMNEEQYAAFLILLQQYHDKVISAEKQYADERKRIIDQQWEDEGYANGYDAADRTIAIAEENLSTMQNANAIAYEQEYFDQYQQLVLNRVALEQWAYEQRLELYKKNSATQEQFQQLDLEHAQTMQKFQQQLLDNYISRYQKMADVTTSYGNIIGDGFGRMIAGEEDAGKQLIKNLLTETIQMASQFAQRLILQSTFGAQMQKIRETQNMQQIAGAYMTAMKEVGIEASKMAAIEAIAAGEITAQSLKMPDSIMTWGVAGAARAAAIIGLVSVVTAAALALVNSMFPESKASSTTNRKLSTGMLTYAEGNYPVLGNDGKVYDAKYEGAGMKTGIYGGGAHFGIFSEKQPEMIVDGKTTQKLILNYPYIYDAITTIAKNGRLVNAMPTFASGDYPAGMQRIAQVEAVDVSGANQQIMDMQEELAQSREVNRRLLKVLEGGLVAHVDGLENYKQQKKNERFLKRRGID